jgi:hypothetical protein
MQEGESGVLDEARAAGGELAAFAQEELGTKASELRQDAEFQLREQIDQRSTQTGEQMSAVGQALNSSARQLHSEGNTSSAKVVESVASHVDSVADYMRRSDADRMLRDLEAFARRRPWLTAGAAGLAGFMASRFVKASSDRRYESSRSTGQIASGDFTRGSLT